jgi:hypothetical protein
MPGKKAASATPSRNLTMEKLVVSKTNAIRPAKNPYVIVMRAIQSRAPTLSMMTLLGTRKCGE